MMTTRVERAGDFHLNNFIYSFRLWHWERVYHFHVFLMMHNISLSLFLFLIVDFERSKIESITKLMVNENVQDINSY